MALVTLVWFSLPWPVRDFNFFHILGRVSVPYIVGMEESREKYEAQIKRLVEFWALDWKIMKSGYHTTFSSVPPLISEFSWWYDGKLPSYSGFQTSDYHVINSAIQ